MKPERQHATITICDVQPSVFSLASATYNLIERDDPSRFELTLRCESHPQEATESAPRLEATIILDAKPPLAAGSEWPDQPGYIDRENLWNVTTFHEWTHENFEDFTVKIIDVFGAALQCEISGHITLNRQALRKTPVVVRGWFQHAPDTRRSVW